MSGDSVEDFINELRKGNFNKDAKMPISIEEAIEHIYSDYDLLSEVVNSSYPDWKLPENYQLKPSFFSNTTDYITLARDFLGLTFYNCTSVVDYCLINDNYQLLKRIIELFVSEYDDYPNLCYMLVLPFADTKKKFNLMWTAFYDMIDINSVKEKTIETYPWTKYLF